MTDSPVQFALKFEQLKSRLRSTLSSDLRFDHLVQFWPSVEPKLSGIGYASYLDEYASLISTVLTDHPLFDLSIEKLSLVSEIVTELINRDRTAKLETVHRRLLHCQIQLNLYVGQVEQAMSICQTLTGETISFPAPNDIPPPNVIPSPHVIPSHEGIQTPIERLESLIETSDSTTPKTNKLLKTIHTEWESATGELHNDRVFCLFVGKDSDGRSIGGQLRQLVGEVEPRKARTKEKKDQPSDTVTFDHQVKAPNDPFVGVAYDALTAARNIAGRSANNNQHKRHNARFSIIDSGEAFTGDSIGLAFALVSFTQLLKPQIKRHERFIPSVIALTGLIDTDGNILPINDGTLSQKITRAFFSHVTTVVLPKANLEQAQSVLDELLRAYPNGHLRLIGHDYLCEVTNDLNLVRAERVCLGQFVARKAYKYSRATKLQVPLLVGLYWLMLAILWPKHFDPGFDTMICSATIDQNRLITYNAAGDMLWSSMDWNTEVSVAKEGFLQLTSWNLVVVDLNGDGKNEVVFFHHVKIGGRILPELHLFAENGQVITKDSTIMNTGYPGNMPSAAAEGNDRYMCNTMMILPRNGAGEKLIVTMSQASFPARAQVQIRDYKGSIIGWFLHQGGVARSWAHDFDNDGTNEIILAGTNNRLDKRAVLMIIKPDGLSGIMPPYQGEIQVKKNARASFVRYISFPRNPLITGDYCEFATGFFVCSDSGFSIDIVSPYKITNNEGFRTYFFDGGLQVKSLAHGDDFYTFIDTCSQYSVDDVTAVENRLINEIKEY